MENLIHVFVQISTIRSVYFDPNPVDKPTMNIYYANCSGEASYCLGNNKNKLKVQEQFTNCICNAKPTDFLGFTKDSNGYVCNITLIQLNGNQEITKLEDKKNLNIT